MKRLCISLVVSCAMFSSVFGYEANEWDQNILDRADVYIQNVAKTGEKEGLTYLFAKVQVYLDDVEQDEQGLFLLQEMLSSIQKELHVFGVWVDWEKKVYREGEKEVDVETSLDSSKNNSETSLGSSNNDSASNQGVSEDNVLEDESDAEKEDTYVSEGMKDFYERYWDKVSSTAPISHLCTKYYDQIDQVAKKYDFPTALIISTWYREHTCIFSNPDNTWGNFQITSHYYAPGDIAWSDLEEQIVNFIEFSKAKWKYYDNVQKFDSIPIVLSYDTIDLLSLRKHAIMYNGLAAGTTPATNVYANQNFDRPADGRDGIVAMTLRAIGRAVTHTGDGIDMKEGIQYQGDKKEEEDTGEEIDVETRLGSSPKKEDCTERFLVDLKKEMSGLDVKAMQDFLKDEGFFTVDATGYYGEKTEEAVNAFQVYYKENILDPGGYTSPTGQWYPATRRKANALWCG